MSSALSGSRSLRVRRASSAARSRRRAASPVRAVASTRRARASPRSRGSPPSAASLSGPAASSYGRWAVSLRPAARRDVREEVAQRVRDGRDELPELRCWQAAHVLEVRGREPVPAAHPPHHPGGPDRVHSEQRREGGARQLCQRQAGAVRFQQFQEPRRVVAGQRREAGLAPPPPGPFLRLVAAAGEEGPGMPSGQRAPRGDRVLQVGQEPRDRVARAGRQEGGGFAVAPAGADVREEPVGERRAAGVAERPVSARRRSAGASSSTAAAAPSETGSVRTARSAARRSAMSGPPRTPSRYGSSRAAMAMCRAVRRSYGPRAARTARVSRSSGVPARRRARRASSRMRCGYGRVSRAGSQTGSAGLNGPGGDRPS